MVPRCCMLRFQAEHLDGQYLPHTLHDDGNNSDGDWVTSAHAGHCRVRLAVSRASVLLQTKFHIPLALNLEDQLLVSSSPTMDFSHGERTIVVEFGESHVASWS